MKFDITFSLNFLYNLFRAVKFNKYEKYGSLETIERFDIKGLQNLRFSIHALGYLPFEARVKNRIKR